MPKRPELDYQLPYADPPIMKQASSPLSILLNIMRRKFDIGDFDGAMTAARIAAPYVHSRVQAGAPGSDLATMPDADLDTLQLQG